MVASKLLRVVSPNTHLEAGTSLVAPFVGVTEQAAILGCGVPVIV